MSIDFRGLNNNGLPLVTIVAGSYNHEIFLEQTLNSIRDQTYPNIELIIIDDCSTDRSVQKIHHWIEKNSSALGGFVIRRNQKKPCSRFDK